MELSESLKGNAAKALQQCEMASDSVQGTLVDFSLLCARAM